MSSCSLYFFKGRPLPKGVFLLLVILSTMKSLSLFTLSLAASQAVASPLNKRQDDFDYNSQSLGSFVGNMLNGTVPTSTMLD